MITVEELFRRLSFGELSNLSLGSEGIGSIEADKQARLLHYANESLLRLHSRFVLLERDLILQTHTNITSYRFLRRHASTYDGEGDHVRYILDTAADPYLEDLIKVMAVYDSNHNQFPLNDNEQCLSLFTPQPNVLQVPRPKTGEYLIVLYQARHPLLDLEEIDLTTMIDLPPVLEGALTAHVAHQVFSNMTGQENTIKAQEHLGKYEMICAEVLDRDLVNSSTSSTNKKFEDRGFV